MKVPTVAAIATVGAQAALFACAANDVEADDPALPDAGADVVDAAVPIDGQVEGGDAHRENQCSAGGFCYELRPNVRNLLQVSGSSMDDIWAVSPNEVVRFRDASWSTVYRAERDDTSAYFSGIWVSALDDVWLLGTNHDDPARPIRLVRYSSIQGGAPAFRDVPLDTIPSPYGEPDIRPIFGVTPTSNALFLLDHRFPNDGTSLLRFNEAADGTITLDRLTMPVAPSPPIAFRWLSLWTFGPNDVYVGGSMCAQGYNPYNGRCAPGWSDPSTDVGVIAHYDGTSFQLTELDVGAVVAMYGSRGAEGPRQLWLGIGGAPDMPDKPLFGAESVRLVPIRDDGSVGAALFHREHRPRLNATCSFLVGSVVSPTAAWLSDGCLVYHWDGADLTVTPTSLAGEPPGRIDGIWAASADDAWIVGRSAPEMTLPPRLWRALAARRTKESAQNEAAR